jgi:hypothetical protein
LFLLIRHLSSVDAVLRICHRILVDCCFVAVVLRAIIAPSLGT